ncbi:hypothetical protein P0G11_12205, partial [Adlercreutzia rubneri]|nr:hypothetical protein [Adlercreutzia rubneri]
RVEGNVAGGEFFANTFGQGLKGRVGRHAQPERRVDPKPFCPHITLGRRVRIPKKPLPPLAIPLPAHARTVTLFKSTLSRDGAEYKPLYTVELGEPAEMPTSTPY